MRRSTNLACLVAPLALIVTSAFAYERLQGPTELLFHNKDKAFQGYTLFGVGGTSYLIDMEGRVVHTWKLGTNPRLLDNGNLLDAAGGLSSSSANEAVGTCADARLDPRSFFQGLSSMKISRGIGCAPRWSCLPDSSGWGWQWANRCRRPARRSARRRGPYRGWSG